MNLPNKLQIAAVLLASAMFASVALAQPQTARPAQTPAPVAELPADPVRALTLRACTGCHALDIIANQRRTREGWYDTVQMMGDRGAPASPAELEQIAAYLYRAYPDQ